MSHQSYNLPQTKYVSRIPRPMQSKIPVREQLVKNTKPKISVVGKNGKTNIIKPIITKKEVISSKDQSPLPVRAVKRKSIGKAKDKIKKNGSKPNSLLTNYFTKKAPSHQVCNSPEENEPEKENELPNTDLALKSISCSPLTKASSLKAIQEQLNLEFVPSEFYRNQILNNKPLSVSQLKELSHTPMKLKGSAIDITSKMQQLTISPDLRLRKSHYKTNLTKSCGKFDRKPCVSFLSPKLTRKHAWSTGGKNKRNLDPYQNAMNSIKQLQERRKTKTPERKPRACVALFQCDQRESYIEKGTLQELRRNTWGSGKQASKSKFSAYENAMADIEKLKEKRSRMSAGEETSQQLRYSWSCGKLVPGKEVDPYEVALEKVKELKTKTPLGNLHGPESLIQRSTSWLSPHQKLSVSPLEDCNSLDWKDGKHSTPNRVTFDLSRQRVYRPLQELKTKSILKQSRLTDISEHSESEKSSTCLESSAERSDISSNIPRNCSKNLNIDAFSTPAVSKNSKMNFHSFSSISALKSPNLCTVVDAFSLSSSVNPSSSKQRKLAMQLSSHQVSPIPFDCSVDRMQSKDKEDGITNKTYQLPSLIINYSESPSEHVIKISSPLLCTPKPLSFYPSARRVSPDELFDRNCCKLTPSHDAPICTPLVLKNIARDNANRGILSPIRQKLAFDSTENNAVVNSVKYKDEPKWEPRYSTYTNSVLTKSKLEEFLADDECSSIMGNNFCVLKCRNLINPIAKILSFGDDMHFVPVSPEVDPV